MNTLGARIRFVRGTMSQDEFSQKIGTSKAAVGTYERNTAIPGSTILLAIYKTFGIDPLWLLTGEGTMRVEERSEERIIESAENVASSVMEVSTNVGVLDRLKQAVNVKTDAELADKLRLTKQAVAAARSRGQVPASWVPKAAQLFGVSTDWIFFGHNEVHKEESVKDTQSASKTIRIEDKIRFMEDKLETTKAALEAKEETLAAYRDIIRMERERSASLEAELAAIKRPPVHEGGRTHAATVDVSSDARCSSHDNERT